MQNGTKDSPVSQNDAETVQFSDEEERIVLNVGGVRHETHVSTLRNIPDTRLSRLAEEHMYSGKHKDVYFFDRHPAVFNSIIDFYRTGKEVLFPGYEPTSAKLIPLIVPWCAIHENQVGQTSRLLEPFL
ncbi:hypothetical protein ACJMK2_041695 [Sinanodonta woodiana]|uniref:BTB domain-containing protein n=1 Tax=Sinanodonta woodiana TaxID=1069815 RepID=A0ABD3W4Z0_SINWO